MPRVFISYGREDWELASRLYRDLRRHGLDPWIDREDLLPGQKWKSAIKDAMRDSEHVLVLLSSRTVDKRGYVQTEVRDALELLREFPDSKVFLIPIRLDSCEPSHDLLRELHWVDLFPDYDVGLAKLLVALRKLEEQEEAASAEPISSPSHQDVLSVLGKEERYVREKLGRPDEVTEFIPTKQEVQNGRTWVSRYLRYAQFGFTILIRDGVALTIFFYRGGVERHMNYPHEIAVGLRMGMTRGEIEANLGRPTDREDRGFSEFALRYGNIPPGFQIEIRFDTRDSNDMDSIANCVVMQKIGALY